MGELDRTAGYEGRGAKARQPRDCAKRGEGRPAEQRRIKDTELKHLPCLCCALIAYFQKDQHVGKQTAKGPVTVVTVSKQRFFRAKANLGSFDL